VAAFIVGFVLYAVLAIDLRGKTLEMPPAKPEAEPPTMKEAAE